MGPSLCCTASFCGSLSSSKYFGMRRRYEAIKAWGKLFVNKILVNFVQMHTQEQILLTVKNQIKEVLPEADIFYLAAGLITVLQKKATGIYWFFRHSSPSLS
jgi:hypothetical protein